MSHEAKGCGIYLLEVVVGVASLPAKALDDEDFSRLATSA